jgi:hypothetical protein
VSEQDNSEQFTISELKKLLNSAISREQSKLATARRVYAERVAEIAATDGADVARYEKMLDKMIAERTETEDQCKRSDS